MNTVVERELEGFLYMDRLENLSALAAYHRVNHVQIAGACKVLTR